MAASRARLRRLRNSPNLGCAASKAPSRVKRSDAPCQVAVSDLLQPGARDHLGKLALARKTADAFDEIRIGVAVAGHDPTEQRHDMKAVEVVKRLQCRHYLRRKFEA